MNQYLKLLNLDDKASLDDIKSSYRRLAKLVHPDITKDNGEKFKALVTAYEWLCDNFGKYLEDTIEYTTRKPPKRSYQRFTKYYRVVETHKTDSWRPQYVITLPERVLAHDTLVYYMLNDVEQSQLFVEGTPLPVTMEVWIKELRTKVTLVFKYGRPEL